MKSSARIFGLSLLVYSLIGCGLKAPLYLPDEQQGAVPASETSGQAPKPVFEGSKVRTLPPAPQAQKKDRERQRDEQPPAPNQSQPPPVSPPDPDRPATTTPPPRGQ